MTYLVVPVNRGDQDRLQYPLEPRQTKRVGEGSLPSRIPLVGHGSKRWTLSGCGISGFLSHVRARATREDRGAVVRRRTAPEHDKLRRSDETSPTVKSSTGNRLSRAFLTVRQETVPNVKATSHAETFPRFRGSASGEDRVWRRVEARFSFRGLEIVRLHWEISRKLCQVGRLGHTPTSGPFGGMYRRHLSIQRLFR
jgi:hypothetical protein